jgi:hypothetical protein
MAQTCAGAHPDLLIELFLGHFKANAAPLDALTE